MERLTKQWSNNHAVPTEIDLDFMFRLDDPTSQGITEIFDRLAAYEATGLSPEELEGEKLLLQYLAKNKGCMVSALRRLQEIMEAEKDGRLVVLPVKV